MSSEMTTREAPPTLIGVFPHPDDELFAGGLLARAARAGVKVAVICATRGEAGSVCGRPTPSPKELGALRETELGRSCAELGVSVVRVLGLPDGGLSPDHSLLVEGALAELEPDVVVTLGPDGVYGHRDHIRLTKIAMQWAAATDTALVGTAFAPGLFAPLWRIMSKIPGVEMEPGSAPEALGCPPSPSDLCIDLAPVAEQKKRAMAAHDSQIANSDPMSFLTPKIARALLESERYTLLCGTLPAFVSSLCASST